ncbi:hypothetical protein DQ04_10021010 [Trypanosoma grayi]|uniref:hypothetical protein n=1 Tax=Trypanosoma grayi TaxID=71804 RepID=UPI0004F419C2|nr:hypothetical protein DQ04_10021010 [Trypanosoma grayi]KEG07365.1 hypothetical protein DQ04_10021010 [Trypanosoma grayi]
MMRVSVRHGLGVLIIALCCLCGCVTAVPAPPDAAETPQRLLERVKAVAVLAKKRADEVMESAKAVKDAAEKSKNVTGVAHAKAVELREALNAVDKGVEQQQSSGAGSDVVTKVKDVMDVSQKAHEALSAAARMSSFYGTWVTEAVSKAMLSQGIWHGRKVSVGQKEAELVERAWEAKEVMVAFLTNTNTKTNGAFTASMFGGQFAKSAKQKVDAALEISQSLTQPGVKPILTEHLVKAADETEKILKQALGEADTGIREANAAFKEAEGAAKSAALMMDFLEKALYAVKAEGTPKPVTTPGAQLASDRTSLESSGPLGDVSHSSEKESDEISATTVNSALSNIGKTGTTTVSPQEHNAADKSKETDAADANAPGSTADTTVRDAWSADSSVSPSWVRTPLLLVVGVLGLLAVC